MELLVPAPALSIIVKALTQLTTDREMGIRVVGNQVPNAWDWSKGQPLLVIALAGGTSDTLTPAGAFMTDERFALEVYAATEPQAMHLARTIHGLASQATTEPNVYAYRSVGTPNRSPHPDRPRTPRWVSFVAYRFRADITE